MRSLATSLFIAALATACSAACSKDEPAEEARPAAPRVEPDPALPSGALATLDLGDPQPFFEGAAALFEGPLLRSFVPESTGAFLRNLAGVPSTVARSVLTGAPLAGVALEVEGERAIVFATRVERRVSGAAPLGAGVQATPGAPSGGHWLRDSEGGDQPEMALTGDLLFVSGRREAIERAHRHLAHRLANHLASPGDARLRLVFEPEALARHARPLLEERARALAVQALAEVERTREEVGRDPELGDPAAAIEALRDAALTVASFLPDLEGARAELGFEGGLAKAELRVQAKEGSPLALALRPGDASRGALETHFGGAPEGAALALGLADGAGFSRALSALGGERLGDADRARLEATFEGGGPASLTLGGDGEGGFLRLARAGAREPGWAAELLAVPHVRALFAALVGCDPPKRAPRLDGAGRGTLCGAGDLVARIAVSEGEETSALGLATTKRGAERADAKGGDRADAHADAARALGSVGDDASYALYLEGSRVIPALSLKAEFHELSALSSPLPPRPIVAAAGAEGREASARIVATRGSVDRLFALLGEARRILAGR